MTFGSCDGEKEAAGETTTIGRRSQSFTSWKLDLLAAVNADERVKDGAARMFVRVLAAMNEETGVAIMRDDTLADEVPSCRERRTAQRYRIALAEL